MGERWPVLISLPPAEAAGREPLAAIRDRTLQDPMYRQYWNRCLSACNDSFYDQYLTPTFEQSPLPSTSLPQREAVTV